MRISLSVDAGLVRKLRQVACERGTTLSGLVRDALVAIAEEDQDKKKRAKQMLERSFAKYQFQIGRREWARDALHDRD